MMNSFFQRRNLSIIVCVFKLYLSVYSLSSLLASNASFEQKCELVKKELQSDYICWSLKRRIKGELIKSKYSISQIKELLPEIMKQNHYTTLLQNEIFRLHRQAEQNKYLTDGMGDSAFESDAPELPIPEENLDVVQNARLIWAKFVKDQLLSISDQMGIPLCQSNSDPNKNVILEKKKKKDATADAESDDDVPRYTGVYSSAKLFETCVHIQNQNNTRTANNGASWGLIKLELKTPTKSELRELLNRLDPEVRQVGLDDLNNEWFSEDCLFIAKKVNQSGYLPAIYYGTKSGVPSSIRPKIWKNLLGVSSSDKEKAYYESLLKDITNRRLLVDDMVHNDVKRTSDDENYFIFEENIDMTMLTFSRDSQVYRDCAIKPIALMSVTMDNSVTNVPYPPSGVIPFEGISLLASPFCYLYNKPEEIYFVFRNFYTRHLCKLHTISSKPESLLHLCKTFEDLLQYHDPQLFYHLTEMEIQPLEIAFNWIYQAFSGYLSVDQVCSLFYIVHYLTNSVFSCYFCGTGFLDILQCICYQY
jgi:hypothetical protein